MNTNRYITSSIFLAAGLSSVSAAALDNITDMRGSDTLFNVTTDAITNCGANCVGHMTYLGTGSGNGESAIYAAPEKQSIAPMSKFIGTAGCGTQGVSALQPPPSTTTQVYTPAQVENNACGLVIGLDGLSIYSSVYTGGSRLCNDTAFCDDASDTVNSYASGVSAAAYPGTLANVPTCSGDNHPAANSLLGLAYDTTVSWAGGTTHTYGPLATTRNPNLNVHTYAAGTYTFSNWTEVLRIIYLGLDQNGCQDCESDVRNGLVNNWGLMFEGGTAKCSGGVPAGAPSCTQLNHAFRRDDQSGTTETFLLLIGAPSVVKKAGYLNSVATADNFCNSGQQHQTSVGGVATSPLYLEHGDVGGKANPPAQAFINPNANDYAPDFRDRDPIRRPCVGTNAPVGTTGAPTTTGPTEQVCDVDGKLGIVLPIIATDFFKNTQLPVFPTNPCAPGTFVLGPVPALNADGQNATPGTCPNGDAALGVGCLVPADATGNPNCMPSSTSVPTAFSPVPLQVAPASANANEIATITGANTAPGAIDGRVYALNAYFLSGSTASYVLDNTLGAATSRGVGPGRAISGMYTRIHASRSMNKSDPTQATCQFNDATQQLGCLVQADECSLSYAGATGENVAPIGYQQTASALLIKGQGAITSNLVNGNFLYPLGRKLYLNTYIGFGNVWGPELSLAKDEATGSFIEPVLTKWGFFTLPGKPFYEQYNAAMLCTGGVLGNGCANDPLGIQALNSLANAPAVTTCGNQSQEAFEDCDNGATGANANVASCPTSNANATSFSLCNQACRTQYCFVPPGGATTATFCPARNTPM